MPQRTLLMVYNADSGWFNTLADIGHKLFSPATYPCALCALTHGHFIMRGEWREFVTRLDLHCEYLHRDQFLERYGKMGTPLPAIFVIENQRPVPCVDAESIAACADLGRLEALLTARCL